MVEPKSVVVVRQAMPKFAFGQYLPFVIAIPFAGWQDVRIRSKPSVCGYFMLSLTTMLAVEEQAMLDLLSWADTEISADGCGRNLKVNL